jgi:probable rRNA maturation factor
MSPSGNLVLFRRTPAGLRRKPLEDFARTLRDEVAEGREFHCLITGDSELRRLNRQFLGHDYPTDVLSFPLEGVDALGELAISARRAAEQAREYGHSQMDEIRILMLHGVLHLLGMDHETDRGAMARAETRWRKKLNLPAALIARTRS